MIDIHSHILSGIDDGARNMEESIEMAKIAYRDGIRKIVATPHYIEGEYMQDREDLLIRVKELNDQLAQLEIGVEILCGNELYMSPNTTELLLSKAVHTINSSRYLLIELPMADIPNYVEDVIYNLKLNNITPIIAHPERNLKIIEDPSALVKFVELGALCQCNANSIRGRFGKEVKNTAIELLRRQMIHVVATDAHGEKSRTPRLLAAYNMVKEMTTREYAESIFVLNPQNIIKDKYIEPMINTMADTKKKIQKITWTRCIINKYFKRVI